MLLSAGGRPTLMGTEYILPLSEKMGNLGCVIVFVSEKRMRYAETTGVRSRDRSVCRFYMSD
ncbi:hypothetical protein JZ751_003833 [Albula glossodonta]|uniref:Uncharacterized protein n=1 Tax=Albula glossodonta TaxID=121402 RepID=A0A8T2PGA5_9TELE|nr:hypothetical protein JZ751_003833 [Albula glossodonta]